MAEIVLYTADERRCTEQIRMFLSETGLRFEEKVVGEADEQQMVKEGKLMFGHLPMLKVGDFTLCEGDSNNNKRRRVWACLFFSPASRSPLFPPSTYIAAVSICLVVWTIGVHACQC